MTKKIQDVETLLKKYGKWTPEMKMLNYHINIMKYDPKALLDILSRDKVIEIDPNNISEEQLAEVILRLIKKCNAVNPEYDSKLDEEMTRIGMNTIGSRYRNIRYVPGKYDNAGLFEDDRSSLPDVYEASRGKQR